MVMWIGADWRSEKCVVAFEEGGRVVSATVKRHPDAVRHFLSGRGDERVVVGIESGDRLWTELWRAAGAEVHVFDGHGARRSVESLCSSGARGDRRSAEELMAMVQSEAHRRNAKAELSSPARALEMLSQLSEEADEDLVRCESELSSILSQVHPALIEASTAALATPWGLRALELAPTPADWNALSSAAQAEALRGTSESERGMLSKALGEQWVSIDADELEVTRLEVRIHVRAMRHALARSQEAKQALAKHMAEHE
ncbi:MAG: hypothetical protein H6746_16465 [Deltaproteobacteria bacterium]|nr:hypothetical protein [Deltaproteobacteria bacterium]